MNWLRENRWRLLATIVLAILWWALTSGYVFKIGIYKESARTTSVTQKSLQKSFADYNAQYFKNELPMDTVIDYDLNDPEFMGTTQKLSNEFYINVNPHYVLDKRTADLIMLHEMCHVKNWGNGTGHNAGWRACMIQLDLAGVFREELIDSYTEVKP